MKKTMIFTPSGDTYLSVTYKEGEVTKKNIRLNSTLYYADVTGSEDSGFAVRFHLPFFRKFNRGGFISKCSAINYQQEILDKNFDNYIAADPDELCETSA